MSIVRTFPFNPLQVNTYLVYEPGGEGVVIDPSCMEEDEFSELKDFIEQNHIRLKCILNTHGHFDHLFGVPRVREAFNIPFLIHPEDEPLIRKASVQMDSFGFMYDRPIPLPDAHLADGEIIAVGSMKLRVIHVPGHSRGGVAFYEPDRGWLFTGDTLFAGGIGRTDLPGGDYDILMASIRDRLMTLPGSARVFPGHGPDSSIREEALNNPFL